MFDASDDRILLPAPHREPALVSLSCPNRYCYSAPSPIAATSAATTIAPIKHAHQGRPGQYPSNHFMAQRHPPGLAQTRSLPSFPPPQSFARRPSAGSVRSSNSDSYSDHGRSPHAYPPAHPPNSAAAQSGNQHPSAYYPQGPQSIYPAPYSQRAFFSPPRPYPDPRRDYPHAHAIQPQERHMYPPSGHPIHQGHQGRDGEFYPPSTFSVIHQGRDRDYHHHPSQSAPYQGNPACPPPGTYQNRDIYQDGHFRDYSPVRDSYPTQPRDGYPPRPQELHPVRRLKPKNSKSYPCANIELIAFVSDAARLLAPNGAKDQMEPRRYAMRADCGMHEKFQN